MSGACAVALTKGCPPETVRVCRGELRVFYHPSHAFSSAGGRSTQAAAVSACCAALLRQLAGSRGPGRAAFAPPLVRSAASACWANWLQGRTRLSGWRRPPWCLPRGSSVGRAVATAQALPGLTMPCGVPPAPDGEATAPLHRLFFINLDRRAERRVHFEHHARANGLAKIISRFPAVDGQSLDLDLYPRTVVTNTGVQCAKAPPNVVNGVYLTRGALGLILSYNTILKRIAADPDDEHIYAIAEDDAVPVEGFGPQLQRSLEALGRADPMWDFLHIGYYDDDCCLQPIEGEAKELLCQPVQVYGLFGAALRPRGARKLLQHLFPLEEQIDSALARVYGKIRAYAVRTSLLTAAHSTASNTDIQILPEGFKFRG